MHDLTNGTLRNLFTQHLSYTFFRLLKSHGELAYPRRFRMASLDERLQLLREIAIGVGKRGYMVGQVQPWTVADQRALLRELIEERMPQRFG
jgi:hypothetical protein